MIAGRSQLLAAGILASLAACHTAPASRSDREGALAAACSRLARSARADTWLESVSGIDLVVGDLAIEEHILQELVAIASSPRRFEKYLTLTIPLENSRCWLGGRPVSPDRSYYVGPLWAGEAWFEVVEAKAAAEHLRALNGKPVWFTRDQDGTVIGAWAGVHSRSKHQRELEDLVTVMTSPLRAIAGPLPTAQDATTALVKRLAADRDVSAIVDSWSTPPVAELLAFMIRDLETLHPMRDFALPSSISHRGYHTSVHAPFDVACFAVRAALGTLTPNPSDHLTRHAIARWLALHLRFSRERTPDD
ncbi:MAG: hypothetical protein NXI31_12885 [bacterium]|nr:hypothetical protein [bacterium]